ncbi:hypothetical protein D9M71_523850 [compost metagenome]
MRVTDIALEKIGLEVLGRVVGDVQVRSELGVTGAVEAMAGQAVLLEHGKALTDRVIGRQAGRRAHGREALGYCGQAANAGNLERPLLGADAPGLRVTPDQIEGPGAGFALGQWWPGLCGVFNGQPGPGGTVLEQRRGRHLGGEAIQRYRLQVILSLDTLQQGSQRHCAVMHGPFVGNIVVDLNVLRQRMSE